jgi:hypothetical protein
MRKFDIDENRRNMKNGENYDRDKRQRQILPPKATLQATTPVPVMHGDAWLWWVTLLENAIFFYGTRLLVNHSDVLTWIDQQSENMTRRPQNTICLLLSNPFDKSLFCLC